MQHKRFLISGVGWEWGREAALRLAMKGHQVIAGSEIWPQVTSLREFADKQKISLSVEKLDIRERADRELAFGWETDVLVNQCANCADLSLSWAQRRHALRPKPGANRLKHLHWGGRRWNAYSLTLPPLGIFRFRKSSCPM